MKEEGAWEIEGSKPGEQTAQKEENEQTMSKVQYTDGSMARRDLTKAWQVGTSVVPEISTAACMMHDDGEVTGQRSTFNTGSSCVCLFVLIFKIT